MNSFIDFNSIGTYLLPVFTSVVSYFAGRRKTKNDFLKDLQDSIDLLSKTNTVMMKEIVALRQENAQLLVNQTKLELRINVITEQNIELKIEVERLNAQLANVRTITKTAK